MTGVQTCALPIYVNGKEAMRQVISKNGTVRVVLPEYYVDGDVKTVLSPYTILYGKNKVELELEKETEVDLIVK